MLLSCVSTTIRHPRGNFCSGGAAAVAFNRTTAAPLLRPDPGSPCPLELFLVAPPTVTRHSQSERGRCERFTEKNFGVIIAFWIPGFLFLWGLSYSLPSVATSLATSNGSNAPTVGGFLYATLASLAVGLVINAVRWALVQEFLLYRVTRLRRVRINYGNLTNKNVLAAFNGAIENNYRYYQYYSNAWSR